MTLLVVHNTTLHVRESYDEVVEAFRKESNDNATHVVLHSATTGGRVRIEKYLPPHIIEEVVP